MSVSAPKASFLPPIPSLATATVPVELVPAVSPLVDNVRFVLEAFDDKRAAEMIANLPAHQRTLDHGRVNRYARMMAAGLWMVTDEPIKVSPSGSVFDGMHRFYGIQAAYKLNPDMEPVILRIAYNSDPETYKVLDQGKPRTFADLLSANPELRERIPAAKTVGASLRIVRTYDQLWEKNDGYWTRIDISHTEAINLLDVYPEIVNGVKSAQFVARNKIKFLLSAMVAVHYLASRTVPDLPVDDFFTGLGDGVNLSAGSPIRAARNWIIAAPSSARVQVSQTGKVELQMKVLINTLNNWAQGKTMERVMWKDGRMPKILGITPKSIAA